METYSNKNFKEKNLEENIAICKEKAKVYNAFYSSSLNALYLFLQRIAIAVVSAMKNKSEIQAMAKKNGVRFNENKPETPVLQLTYMDILKTLSDEERKKQIGKMYKWATALKTARESGIKAEDICEHLEKNGISQKKNPTKKDDKHVSDNRGTSSGKKCPSKKSEKNS
ncbi:MAG: hypothetical protein KAJ75_01190, partial [Alphaproteobacteria bacterium]|nr:hypothetical protein [Alphaproteobacteria bacterium]